MTEAHVSTDSRVCGGHIEDQELVLQAHQPSRCRMLKRWRLRAFATTAVDAGHSSKALVAGVMGGLHVCRVQRKSARLHVFVSLAGILGLVLSACGDGNPVTPTGKATAVISAPTSLAPADPVKPTDIAPPQKPAAMSTPDEEGAVAAAEYFLRMTTYAAATGDTAELEAMSSPDCQFCASYLESVATEYAAGNAWATVPEIDIEFANTIPTDSSDSYQVNLRTKKGTYDYFNETDGLRHGEAESFVMVLIVTSGTDYSWTIEAVQDFPPETDIPGENP